MSDLPCHVLTNRVRYKSTKQQFPTIILIFFFTSRYNDLVFPSWIGYLRISITCTVRGADCSRGRAPSLMDITIAESLYSVGRSLLATVCPVPSKKGKEGGRVFVLWFVKSMITIKSIRVAVDSETDQFPRLSYKLTILRYNSDSSLQNGTDKKLKRASYTEMLSSMNHPFI